MPLSGCPCRARLGGRRGLREGSRQHVFLDGTGRLPQAHSWWLLPEARGAGGIPAGRLGQGLQMRHTGAGEAGQSRRVNTLVGAGAPFAPSLLLKVGRLVSGRLGVPGVPGESERY